MKTIMRKTNLVIKIEENKKNHRKIFEEAIIKFREEAIKILDSKIERLKKGKLPNLYVQLPVPTDHTKDYERVLKMLVMDTRNEIDLSEQEFATYVLDDWGWKKEWVATTSNYVNLLTETIEEEDDE